MNLSKVSRCIGIVIWTLIGLAVPIRAFSNEKLIWSVSELRANTEQGGQANTIAVNPANRNEMFVASESGGLFKSTDRGLHWTHVDSLPVIFTQSVAFVDSNVLMVSAKADFKTKNGGGIWRSTDGGGSWTQAPLVVPGFNGRLSAYEISGMFGVAVVGTSQGVFVTGDGGGSWRWANPFGDGDGTVYSVLLSPFNGTWQVYAGGPAGVRLGTLALSQWVTPGNGPGAILDLHAFGSSPRSGAHAFVVNGTGQLFRTETSGNSWIQMLSAPTGGGFGTCAGGSFIKSAMRRDTNNVVFLDLYFGNRCGLHRLAARVNGAQVDFTGTWQQSLIARYDTRDLALFNADPVLLATNGGLHNTVDGGVRWNYVGGGRDGYNALQVNEVTGQFVESAKPGDPGTTDLYFATWDNNLWAATVSATIHRFLTPWGFHIDAEPRIPPQETSRITFKICRGCPGQAERRLANERLWNDAPGATGAPVFIRRNQYVQNVPSGLDLTEDADSAAWRPFARFPDEPRGIPKLARAGTGDRAIVYQPYRSNFSGPPLEGATRLMRVRYSQGNGVAEYPAMNGFGGLGMMPLPIGTYPVYGVDPRSALHLIAPDLITERMRVTWNGGESWDEIPGLTDLVTDHGNLRFRTPLVGSILAPLVTAVSFSPHDPSLVLIGTIEGGIFFSADRGRTWRRIEGSERATFITSFYWETNNSVFISTFGRGLWKLANRRIFVQDAFDALCATCGLVSNDGTPGRPQFGGSVLAFEGRIAGVRTDQGRLREVFVTPGSSVAFTGDLDDSQDDIAVIETNGRESSEPLPKPPDGWIATGVLFAKDDRLTGTAFAKSEMSLLPPAADDEVKGSTRSPAEGMPYIRLTSAEFHGLPSVVPQEVFELSATAFAPGGSYELLLDGVLMKGKVSADGYGSFTTRISAPPQYGYHTVEVRPADGDQVIDGSTFLVTRRN